MTELLRAAPSWVACDGAARAVSGGTVACPRLDIVSWQRCLDCHLLEAVEDDRDRGCGELAWSHRDGPSVPPERANRPARSVGVSHAPGAA
jgi:hypothetical protein